MKSSGKEIRQITMIDEDVSDEAMIKRLYEYAKIWNK